jgi:hypothetical protein
MSLSTPGTLSSFKNNTDSLKYHIYGVPDVAHEVKKLAPNIT